jgi:integrase
VELVLPGRTIDFFDEVEQVAPVCVSQVSLREPVIPAQDGGFWSEIAYEQWRSGIWLDTLAAAGVERQRPYDLRHSFASLLLHEGRSVIYVARQLGHGAALTMSTYGHCIDEMEDTPNQDAETAIREARLRDGCPQIAPGATDAGTGVASQA